MLSMDLKTVCVDFLTMLTLVPSATAYEIVRRGVPSRALIVLGDYVGIGRGAEADLVGPDRATVS